MKVLFAAAEVAPLTKVGGLADVVRSLPKELIQKGHDVRIIVPGYGFLDLSGYEQRSIPGNHVMLSLGEYRKISVTQITVEDIKIYMLGNDIFSASSVVYGENEVEKFFVFCESVGEVLPHLGWHPEIVHCHDWHAALIPLFIKNKGFNCRTVFTIHNIGYQGHFDDQVLHKSGIGRYWQARLPGGNDIPLNFMSQGILWADVINTVSENFAREILTPEYGWGMEKLLNFRSNSLYGIRNGLGYEEYDPRSDQLIAANYSSTDIKGKYVNKKSLQKLVGFKADPGTPLIGMVSRLDEQKGLSIIIKAIPALIKDFNVQFIFLGRGRDYYEEVLNAIEARYPDNVKVFITFDNKKAHLIYAGADIFLMPSKWEPCGLGQLIAMRYGTVPVVRKTGGLADTVQNLSDDLKLGTGFVFDGYNAVDLALALTRAAGAYSNRIDWNRIMCRIMEQDFTWREPADRYEQLYRSALERSGDAA